MHNIDQQLAALFEPWDNPDSPGCALGIIHNAQLIHAQGYGMANLEKRIPLSPQSQFYIASTSKQFTAGCILLLAQAQALDLDDPVQRHLPELPQYEAPITIRHLIHHTSGLRDYLTLMDMAGWSFEDAFDNQVGLDLLYRQERLNFLPGQQHLYCNSGYKLMAEIVHRVSGLSLRAFAQQEIFAPLGMTDTFFDDSAHDLPGRVLSYQPDEKDGFKPFAKRFTIVGSGGLLSNIDDLYKWDQNFYQPQVGGSAFVKAQHRCGQLDNGELLNYAAGLSLGEYKGLKTVSHGGGMLGFRTQMLRFPEQSFTVICLGNLSTINTDRLARQVADLYLREAFQLDPFAGQYYSSELDTNYKLSVEDADLWLQISNRERQALQSPQRDVFSLDGRMLNFIRDDFGQVSGFTLRSGRAHHIHFERA